MRSDVALQKQKGMSVAENEMWGQNSARPGTEPQFLLLHPKRGFESLGGGDVQKTGIHRLLSSFQITTGEMGLGRPVCG